MEDVAKAQKQDKASLANMDAFEKVLARIPKEAITAALKDGRFTLNGKVETSMTYEKLCSLIERERTSSVTDHSDAQRTILALILAVFCGGCSSPTASGLRILCHANQPDFLLTIVNWGSKPLLVRQPVEVVITYKTTNGVYEAGTFDEVPMPKSVFVLLEPGAPYPAALNHQMVSMKIARDNIDDHGGTVLTGTAIVNVAVIDNNKFKQLRCLRELENISPEKFSVPVLP